MIETETLQETLTESKTKKRSYFLRLLFVLTALLVIGASALLLYGFNLNEPTSINWEEQSFTVQQGDTVQTIARNLEDIGIVKSKDLLYAILVTQFDPTKIKASRYIFDSPLTTYEVAARLIAGDFDSDLLPVTIIEGESRNKISQRLAGEVEFFDSSEFLALTDDLEGQLFPDTYFVPKDFTTAELVDLLHLSYRELLDQYESKIIETGLTEAEVVTLASIVEREANTEESMKYVAGIFFNRIEIGMALQADATIEYVLDEGLHELAPGELAQSLREVDSPYNTYLYRDLPPTPIGNPGRIAIEAVLFPSESDYFYYITGDDGEFYYAETYNQHLRNIDLYLR